ncbi:hypothetical protein ROA7450_03980 [Roseovarius albus]|uniref:DUF6998 domain-containing protein n=2 Tax=Roseovarius albus TaxID=1247867 RepID=A0A1X7A6W4_9RHOB|nr:hypothetical protein ROA7450_03980 [Roseovarius albus]
MPQTLSQTQIIRSLGQALEWFEKEVGWGVSPGELNHLTGRIGELYAAMVTRGQMALATNQRGYDVVSLQGEYISVKTVTSSNHVKFRASTFDIVQRVMILRLVVEDDTVSIEEILDCSADDIRRNGASSDGSFTVSISGATSENGAGQGVSERLRLPIEDIQQLKETGSASYGPHRIVQYENGTILVETNGIVQEVAKPILREVAKATGVEISNAAGNMKNTRSLGSDIIKALS